MFGRWYNELERILVDGFDDLGKVKEFLVIDIKYKEGIEVVYFFLRMMLIWIY